MIWESDDLVNWSEQRSVPIADENTHYAWAPEAIYDELHGEYIVILVRQGYYRYQQRTITDAVNVVVIFQKQNFYSFTPHA